VVRIGDKLNMNSNPLVSVVIPTYGRSTLLERAIKSVLNQTYDNVEIVVIDDNDSDSEHRRHTEKVLQKYLKNNQVVYLKHEKNAGGCAARNTGIRSSKGMYVGFLDDDDEWLPEFVVKHMEKLSNDAAEIVYCNYFSTADPLGVDRLAMASDNKIGYVFDDLLTGWCPSTTSLFLIKKECFSTSGYFDESLQSFQDYDMWLSMARNHRFDCCDEYLVVKYQHGFEQLARNPIKRQNALNTLKKKWKNILNETEYQIFSNATRNFQKAIYYNEFRQYREKKQFIDAVKKFTQILKMGDNNVRDVVKLFFILIFGHNANYRFNSFKKSFNSGQKKK